MRASISSSNERLPHQPWTKTWLAALVLVLNLTVAWESYARLRGHRPMVLDDRDLWCQVRATVDENDPRSLVLAGTSRLQSDIDTAELRAQLPGYTVAQLSIDGSSPRAILRSLAEETTFRSIVIYDVL